MSLFDGFDIRDLAKVLKQADPNREDDDDDDGNSSDEEHDKVTTHHQAPFLGPSDIAKMAKKEEARGKDTRKDQKICTSTSNNNNGVPTSELNKKSAKEKTVASPNAIWSEDELKMKSTNMDGGDGDFLPDITNETRKVPLYEMYFRQSVTTEDVYLQMGHKTPATSSCENLVVKISLPGESHKLMQLDLKNQRIELRSPLYILILPTPQPIDPRAGDAKWDKDSETLILTLKLKRDMDFVNF